MTFRWWADDGPLIVVLGSTLPSSTKKRKKKKKRSQSWTHSEKTFWIRACVIVPFPGHAYLFLFVLFLKVLPKSWIITYYQRSLFHSALTLCTLSNVYCLYYQLLTFSKLSFQKHYQSVKRFGFRSGTTSSEFLSVLIWVTCIGVCKGN